MAEGNGEPPKKLSRRPKFSEAEIMTLVEEVEKRQGVVTGRHDYKTGVTAQKKQLAWQQICFAVNAVSRVPRSVDEVRRKFIDMKTHVKSKAAGEVQHLEGTGGGPPLELKYSAAEQIIFRLLSPTTYAGHPRPDSGGSVLNVSAAPVNPPEVDPLAIDDETPVFVIEDEEVTIPVTPACGSGSTSSKVVVTTATPQPSTSAAPPHSSRSATNRKSGRKQSAQPADSEVARAFLSTQQDIRGLLTELVETQRSGVAALQEFATVQKQHTDAIVALAKCCQQLHIAHCMVEDEACE